MKNYDFFICNADTDGVSFKKKDQKPWSDEERAALLADLNSQMDELIKWEDDGVLKKQIVVKAKNYVMQDHDGNVKIKGSGLKATQKEKALQSFIRELIDLMLKDRMDQIFFLYLCYAHEIMNLTDIADWCAKVTVTKSVLDRSTTRQDRVLNAIGNMSVSEGDKVYLFNLSKNELCLRENFKGDYDRKILLGKLYDTLSVFDTIIDLKLIPNFSLKRNESLLTNRATDAISQLQMPEVQERVRSFLQDSVGGSCRRTVRKVPEVRLDSKEEARIKRNIVQS